MHDEPTAPPLPRGASIRRVLAALLDVAATLKIVQILASVLASETVLDLLGEDGLEEDPARGLRAVVILLLVRVLVEASPAWWAVPARRLFGDRSSDGSRALATDLGAGALGGLVAGLALTVGWTLAFPRTDYGSGIRVVTWSAAAGLAVGVLAGAVAHGLSRAGRPIGLGAAEGAPLRLAALLGAGAVIALLGEADPTRDWVYPRGLGTPAAIGLGAATAVLAVVCLAVGARWRLPWSLLPWIGIAALLFLYLPRGRIPAGAVPAGAPRGILLVTIDTLRADHLGCYGYERDTSPNLDAFAKEAVLFERAFAAMPSTDPSHAAILTGFHPRTTGIMANALPATRPDLETIASWLGKRGYRTGAITSRAHLNPVSLRLPGFDFFSAPTDGARSTEAAHALRRAEAWLDRHGDAPFFLWVHFWDPHGPYDPPREQERSMFVDAYRGPLQKRTTNRPYSAQEYAYATGLYDGEIRYADDHVGRLIESARETVGGRENVLVVVTSDHGESFDELDDSCRAAFEDGYAFDHGDYLAPQEIHVPLLVSWPGHVRGGRRVKRAVSIASVAPTIARLVGGELNADVGDVVDLIDDPDAREERPVFAERRIFFEPPHAAQSVPELGVVRGNLLYVENGKRGRFLHDLVADPAGARNLVEAELELADTLAKLIGEWTLGHPPAPVNKDALTGEKSATMDGLGYVR